MWSWLMSLDAATRAALIGGAATVLSVFGALIGVYANLAWNRKQHRDEKSYSLRRDVYLEVIETIYRALVALAQGLVAKDRKLPDGSGAEVTRELYAAFAKVQVLGERRVIAAVMAFEEVYDELSRNVGIRRETFEAMLEKIEKFPNEPESLIKKLFGKLGQTNEDAKTSERDAAAQSDVDSRIQVLLAEEGNALAKDEPELLKQVHDAVKELNGALASISSLLDELFKQIADVLACLLEIAQKSGPAVHELIVAMKSDLGVLIDEKWYKGEMQAMLERSIRSSKERVDRLHTELRTKYSEIQRARVTLTIHGKSPE
jgi:hypothetical protein